MLATEMLSNYNYKQFNDILGIMRYDIEFDEPESLLMENYTNYGFIKKDVLNGELLRVTDMCPIDDIKFNVVCDTGFTIACNLKKERKFFDLNSIEYSCLSELAELLKTQEFKEWLKLNKTFIKVTIENLTFKGSLIDAFVEYSKDEMFEQVKKNEKFYYAKVKERNKGGYFVEVNGVDAFLPGGLASANKINNFDCLLDKRIPVMIEDYIHESNTFIVSNKKYISKILPERVKELCFDDEYEGTITGTAKFGIFIEFSDVLTGLLHVSEMDVETYDKFVENEYHAEDTITFYIKEIQTGNKIILTKKMKEKEIGFEEFKDEFEGKICSGEIVNINSYGAFIKFIFCDKDFIGLLYTKTLENFRPRMKDNIDVLIEKVDPETNKIFLSLID